MYFDNVTTISIDIFMLCNVLKKLMWKPQITQYLTRLIFFDILHPIQCCSKFIGEIRRFRKNQGINDPMKNILTQKESISSLTTSLRSQMPDVCFLLYQTLELIMYSMNTKNSLVDM